MTRLIAGSHGGRRLQTPAGAATRPTTDRVREAFFAALAAWAGTGAEPAEVELSGLSFLDLFAGSGAMALEAASRGAGPVWAVERDPRTAGLLRRNATSLGLAVAVRTAAVRTLLATPAPHPFDVCWFDPPYQLGSEELDELVQTALAQGWLAADGVVVLERSRRSAAPVAPPGLERWQRRYGETVLHWGMREREEES